MSDRTMNWIWSIILGVMIYILVTLIWRTSKKIVRIARTKLQAIRSRGKTVAAES